MKFIQIRLNFNKTKLKHFIKRQVQKTLGLFNYKLSRTDEFPPDADKKIIEFIKSSLQFSMTGTERMYLLSQAITNTKINKLEGDFVECGIWMGGNILLFKQLNDYYNLNKSIFGFDTFDGMTVPEEIDKDYQEISAKKLSDHEKDYLSAGIEKVRKNILKYSNLDNINLIKGKVEDTLLFEKNLPKKISILRLDTDWYASTKVELEILYPRLVHGGVLIIDDYGHWKGARKAVDEFFGEKKWLHVVDYSCRYLIKN